ncbi:MAG: TonB-dependent hemoglobin/transferrin/lactoferrin family receptor [Lysobacterales bacterium]
MILAAGLLLFLAPVRAVGADTELSEDPAVLDTVIVVASKIPLPLSGVAAQVTVIGADDIRNSLAEDMDGVLRYQPGLEVERAGTRFDNGGINIRGIGGNRVRLEVDGVPVRDGFAIGAYSNAGRVLIEPERIKRVEVLHGPASVMYGANALGGVFAVTTWDPEDLRAAMGDAFYGELRTGYQGMDHSWVYSGLAAWGDGAHGLLAAATLRNGHEQDHAASGDIPADPQDWSSDDYLARYTWDSPGGSRLRFSATRIERDVSTRIESQLGYGRRFQWTTSLRGDDHDRARRLSIDYTISSSLFSEALIRAYDTRQETRQLTLEERARAPRPVSIRRQFDYQQDRQGLEGFVFREAGTNRVRHRIGLGAQWNQSDVEELRDGTQTGLEDGNTTTIILGEEMPVRDFPISRTGETGAWLQDEMTLLDGRMILTPALRWDHYRLSPRPDETWREDNPETPVVGISESQLTPHLGLVFRAGGAWNVYGQFAEGFRAPPFEDANIGFTLPLFGYRAIPNPDLKSERSQGFELGVRRIARGSRFEMALFRTDYDDFIESRALIGRDPETGDLLFQSRNIGRARIRGVDLRYQGDLGALNELLEGWRLELAGFWSEGENRDSGAPLNSVSPAQAVVRLLWSSAGGGLDLGASLTATAAKGQGDIDTTSGPRFETPGWTTLDLSAGWRPAPGIELRAALFNLTDRSYWRWLDVANLLPDDPMIPLLSRPGRSFSVNVRLSF